MKDLENALSKLQGAYKQQLTGYSEVLSQGAEERDLVTGGKMSQLVELLADKDEKLAALEEHNKEIQDIQQWFCRIFALEEFTLSALEAKIPERFKDKMAELKQTISELVTTLESLEQQELAQEKQLKQIGGGKSPNKSTGQARARQAYQHQGKKP